MNISQIIAVIGVLVAITNVIVEVIKKATWNKIPTSILAVAVSEVLTVVSGFAYWQMKNLPLYWHTVFSFFVIGLLVSYAAMFGFDKLKDALGGNRNE